MGGCDGIRCLTPDPVPPPPPGRGRIVEKLVRIVIGLFFISLLVIVGHRRKPHTALLVITDNPWAELTPAVASQGEQLHTQYQFDWLARCARQSPGTQGTFFAADLEWMPGGNGADGLIDRADLLS